MAMIAQEQNLRQFVTSHLTDIVDWAQHVRPDPEKKSNGDQAFILISTPYNRYKLSIASGYIEPPAGAPLECRALGTVTFYDPADGKQIVAPKADKTWTEISKHMHAREYTDAIAVTKRELAEAAPENAGPLHVKLAGLMERGRKWNLGIPTVAPMSMTIPVDVFLPAEKITKPGDVTWIQQGDLTEWTKSGDRRMLAPFVGAPIVYITNPGEAIGGQSEIPGHCAKVISPDRISVFITPDHSEPCYRDNLMRRGSDAGGGRVHQSNCWDFNPHWLAEQERVKTLESDLHNLHEAFEALARRVTAAETKARTEAITKPKKAKADAA